MGAHIKNAGKTWLSFPVGIWKYAWVTVVIRKPEASAIKIIRISSAWLRSNP
jgi:hypothetical protein